MEPAINEVHELNTDQGKNTDKHKVLKHGYNVLSIQMTEAMATGSCCILFWGIWRRGATAENGSYSCEAWGFLMVLMSLLLLFFQTMLATASRIQEG